MSQLKKKKNPTIVLTLKTENKNDSIKNQNNFFFGWARGGSGPLSTPPGSVSACIVGLLICNSKEFQRNSYYNKDPTFPSGEIVPPP